MYKPLGWRQLCFRDAFWHSGLYDLNGMGHLMILKVMALAIPCSIVHGDPLGLGATIFPIM